MLKCERDIDVGLALAEKEAEMKNHNPPQQVGVSGKSEDYGGGKERYLLGE